MSKTKYADTWHDLFRKNKKQVQPTVIICESHEHILYMYAPPRPKGERPYFVQTRQGKVKGSFWSERWAREFIEREEPDWDGLDYVSGWDNKTEKYKTEKDNGPK